MTRRDGDATIKMIRMDRQEPRPKKHSLGTESRDDTSPTSSASNMSKHRHDRDTARSTSNSLPGSRASSRPGSRMASRTNSQESIIDLFDSMTLAYSRNGQDGKGFQLISPKPRNLPHQRWTWADKLRINSAIWRCWHIQFVKGKKPMGCHFDSRLPESRPTLQADAIQSGRGTIGSIQYNQSQVGSVVRDYRRWRLYHMDTSKPGTNPSQVEPVENPEENAFKLDTPHPPLSPMAARTLLNDDLSKDFSDTLFISKKKHFTVLHPKKIARHVYNADIFQPGLMQLEPDFGDDFMDTLDSIQDTLCKTPTKVDLRSLIEFNEDLLGTESISAFSDSLLGPLTTVSEETTEAQQDPVPASVVSAPYLVTVSPRPASVARNLSFPSSPAAPISSSAQLWDQANFPMPTSAPASTTLKQFSASAFAPQSTSSASSAMTSGAGLGQMPPIFEVSGAGTGSGGMAMQVDVVPSLGQQNSSVTFSQSQVFSTAIPKQEPYSPSMATSPQSINTGMDISDALEIIAAQFQQQQQQQQKEWQQQQLQSSKQQVSTPSLQPAPQKLAVSGSQTSWSGVTTEGKLPISPTSNYTTQVEPNWPNSNLPQALPSTGMNWSLAGGMSAASVMMGGFPQGIMSQGGLSSSNMAFIQNAGGFPAGMIPDTMAPMDQNIILGAAYSQQNNTKQSLGLLESSHGLGGHGTPGHTTPGHKTPGHVTPGHVTPGHVTPGHVTPGHKTPGHVTPGHKTPGHVTPGQATPGYVTPGHVTPGHVTPGHVTPGHVTPGHVTPGHVTPGPLTPQMDESMEFEEFPFPSASKNSSSTSSSYKAKRERSHSRKNSHDRSPRVSQVSPRVSQVGFSDSASYTTFLGKSEAKDLGMPSPSEMSVNPFLPSSGHPSNVSSAASSPGSVTEGTEFEFPAPQTKRRKTPENNGEKETRRRYKHLQSEHKRRFNIQSGLDEIQRVVPSLRNTSDSSKSSTATMLQKAHEHIMTLKAELKDLRDTTEKLREEIQALNTEIDSCQDELPDTGAPVTAQSDRQLYQMMETYTHQKVKQNWTFWIFSLIIQPLFETYLSAVSSSHVSDFDQTVQDWTEGHCRLKPLRKLVTAALTKVSKETSILMDPAALPAQIKEMATRDTDQRAHGKT
ncbi:MLX-interacting protein-like isoform X2 [Acanthaster planci]|uniref:MLX-interacting protein-like isoform X2 n=1 Tax=Acanthaster planci TaxID=133434 RepID=A0A8B7ZIZ0_ACAPL|nr:MLX-interacting protein-like isoform X2 [Acanthaster planci]